MKILAWYSAMTLSLTVILAVYGFFITKETPLPAFIAINILYLPPALYILLRIFEKKRP